MIKPYYKHNGITIYHGDCLEILPKLPEVDLVLTDPPYLKEYLWSYSELSKWSFKLLPNLQTCSPYSAINKLIIKIEL